MKIIGKLPLEVLPVLTLMAAPLLVDSAIALPGDPNFLCFRKYSEGQVENLERMCPKKPIVSNQKGTSKGIKNRVRISKDARRVLDFVRYNYDGRKLVALVKNKTDKPLSRLSITFVAYNQTPTGEALVDTGSAVTEKRTLGQGQQTSFEAELENTSDFIEITSVEPN